MQQSDTCQVNADFSVRFTHRLFFTRDVLAPTNPTLAQALTGEQPEAAASAAINDRYGVLAFVDDGVAHHWPDITDRFSDYVEKRCGPQAFVRPAHVISGGESCKNDRRALEEICQHIHEAKLCRRSYVVAVGGGAVLDTVGFAASVAHRGVRCVRLPTTTLGQADAAIGVKNGVNAFGQKNFFGCFSPPWAIINDERFLSTLSDRNWRCGFSEAVKVALVKDRCLFDDICASIPELIQRNPAATQSVLRRSAMLHFRHITDGGDPFELAQGRPLDFGHWSAHKLEQMSNHRLSHGEAVAIGVALDAVYSWLAGLLDRAQAHAVIDCLMCLGFKLNDPTLGHPDALLDGLDEFRQHLGGPLTITLLAGIGRTIDVHEIDRSKMIAAVKYLNDIQVSAGSHATGPSPWSSA